MVATSMSGSVDATSQTSFHNPASQPSAQSSIQPTISDEPDHSSDSDDGSNSSSVTDFDTTHCLFCNSMSESIDTNLIHMSRSHGMTIPSPHQLTVDPTTLLTYLNLVISVYHECLSCGTQRRNTQAIQQHMLGKGHCAFDISDVESEYREFWDFSGEQTKVEVDGDNILLPSGRTVLHRSTRTTQRHQRLSTSDMTSLSLSQASLSSTPLSDDQPTTTSPVPTQASQKQALTKQDLRALTLNKHLSTLRTSDRLALAHLPASEQRAILSSQHKQLQKARRQERDMQARLQRKNNQTMMQHFVSDVPGPKLG
ncbi:hypothetical protein M438DRAFT_350161 [Aureobasidium pullulans EXF-150]|uniref:ZN622/Rei1/Reh1 zinc finger C2H2-type domain-containing protein n=1 Tax=Aureobasidium pullulans EXF-150 TaxID=1043002 RepID=A0A074X9M8_AURPU|nr:uncharacterized protein M438DRAFT_350161 [Aureobasidium pullulans EXF-150]KEQ78762.1 hypothetical protein M438DRAFT_350161 [Aureobasidium pullulans EXF-150]